jgi:hypothetical protein
LAIGNNLARSSQPNWLLNKVVTAGPFYLPYISLLDWEQATGVWAVLVDAAKRTAIRVLLQKRAFEYKLTASSAAIALTASQRQRRNRLLLTEVGVYKATNLTLGLPRTEFCIGNLARSKALGETLLKRTLFV